MVPPCCGGAGLRGGGCVAGAGRRGPRCGARLKLVQYAHQHGVKPAAREFGCQPRIARKWLHRWRQDNFSKCSLMDRSRAPRTCPHKTPPEVERQVLRERDKAPCLGARRLKDFCQLTPSEGAIARILRQSGRARSRKKKYQKKRDMREVKARLKAFEQVQIDTKYLDDIPFYVEQMARNGTLPRFQYTARDVRTGAVFTGFASDLSETYACVFGAAVLAHLARTGHLLENAIVQTDNGSEYSGNERKARHDRGFTHVVRDLFKLTHRFIPPGKKNHQADVETLHERIEAEFLDLERFASRKQFFEKASMWQLWWNTTRKNGYKHHRAPDHILLETKPQRDPAVWLLPALDLDDLLAKRIAHALNNPKGGYYVPALPEKNDVSVHFVAPEGAFRLTRRQDLRRLRRTVARRFPENGTSVRAERSATQADPIPLPCSQHTFGNPHVDGLPTRSRGSLSVLLQRQKPAAPRMVRTGHSTQ